MSTVLEVITPEDLLRMGEAGRGFELVDGELKELDASARSSRVGGQVYRQLENSCRTHHPGWVFPPGTGFRCFVTEPGKVRKPDTSYIALDRLTREEYEADGFIEVVPDLVAEVVSPNDSAEELGTKIEDWLQAGVKIVWEIYPAIRIVRAHSLGASAIVFRGSNTLTAPEVLPGFSCPVLELFQLPGEVASSPASPPANNA